MEEWQPASAPRRRPMPREVDVWSVPLERLADRINTLQSVLSPDERERADRFYFERDRRRFVGVRAVLRVLLGAYLQVDARDLTFSYGPQGKPALTGRFRDGLSFNVSHSHELALLAVGPGIDIGVDVEAVRPMNDIDDIAARFFSPREADQLRSLPASVRTEAFFACWTRKEAYLKALGSGLARPLDGFDVTFAPGEPATLAVHGDHGETARWCVEALSPADGYAAALVTEGGATTRCWRWSDH